MDKKNQSLCGLAGRNLCELISDGQCFDKESKDENISSLYALGGKQLSNALEQVSSNLQQIEDTIKKDKNTALNVDAICGLGGRQLCSIITDIDTINQNIAKLEEALTVIGNGSYAKGLKQVIALSEAVAKARRDYPAEMWKEAGKEGIEKAFFAKLKEVENAKGSDEIISKIEELASIKVRMFNKEWE